MDAPADPSAFEEEMTVLALLEGLATSLAAPNLGPDDVAQLRDVNRQMAEAMEHLDSLRFGRLNQEFHAIIYDHCPNAALVGLLRDVARRLDAIRRTVFVQIPYRGAASLKEHNELIDLIERGAPAAKIETLARQHKLHTVESFRAWQEEHEG
jgi:DNA-binding GntR family transcriptional regulator